MPIVEKVSWDSAGPNDIAYRFPKLSLKYGSQVIVRENQWGVFRQIFTNISITGTSMSTPTTVARAAPEESPKSIVAVAMATSKWFEAPIMAEGAASSYESLSRRDRP